MLIALVGNAPWQTIDTHPVDNSDDSVGMLKNAASLRNVSCLERVKLKSLLCCVLKSLLHAAMQPLRPTNHQLTQIDAYDPIGPFFGHPVRGDCCFSYATVVAATSPGQLDHIMAVWNGVHPPLLFEDDGIYVHVQSLALREILVTYLGGVKAILDAQFGDEPSGGGGSADGPS